LLAALSAISLATAAAAQITVTVGGNSSTPGGIFQYIPANVTAANGTVVTFKFLNPGNHSIAQSSFSNPCNLTNGGFDSGWVSVGAGVTDTPEWNLTITNASRPIWFYCKQLNPSPHCNAGMVGSINAAIEGNFTFDAYRNIALNHTGPSDQSNGHLEGVGAGASALPGPVPSGVTLFGSPTPGAAGAAATGSASATGSVAAGTGASSSSTASGSTPSSNGAASQIAASSILVLFAAALGFTMV